MDPHLRGGRIRDLLCKLQIMLQQEIRGWQPWRGHCLNVLLERASTRPPHIAQPHAHARDQQSDHAEMN